MVVVDEDDVVSGAVEQAGGDTRAEAGSAVHHRRTSGTSSRRGSNECSGMCTEPGMNPEARSSSRRTWSTTGIVLFAGLRELGEGGGGVAPQLGRAGELGWTARRGAGGRSILGIALGQQFSTYLGWLISWGTPLTLVGDPAGRPPTPRR